MHYFFLDAAGHFFPAFNDGRRGVREKLLHLLLDLLHSVPLGTSNQRISTSPFYILQEDFKQGVGGTPGNSGFGLW